MNKICIFVFILFHYTVYSKVEFAIGSPDSITSGNTIVVPITVKNFIRIMIIQGNIRWDPKVLEFQKLQDFGLRGTLPSNFVTNSAGIGVITFTYDDPSGLEGVTYPDGSIIFSLVFKVIDERRN